MSSLPTPAPRPNSETEPFWTAAADGRLVLPVCDTCGHPIWYPRAWCPVCGGGSVTWTELGGAGTVYACTVIRRGMGQWAGAVPYVVAYVELAEGPRILTNVVTDDPESVHIGMPVTAIFVEAADTEPPQSILRFKPTS